MYLGPALPRWWPQSIIAVQAAIDDGTLAERHWLDVKATVGSSHASRAGLAKDLASFAVDGGALIIGVTEDKTTGTLTCTPIPLAGVAEQIEQIAQTRCDPPVYVVCHPLADPADDIQSTGLLIVEVPPSPMAPHMAGGRYYGRGDKTNHQLEDNRVAQLHAVRTMRQITAEQLIAREVARDPVPADRRELAHLFVVAQPLASPPDLATRLIEGMDLYALVQSVQSLVPRVAQLSPSWSFLGSSEPRAAGRGFHNGLPGRLLAADSNERGAIDLEVHDDGSIVMFYGRASDGDRGGEEQWVIDEAVAIVTRAVVALVGKLGATTGYAGRWMLAVGVTDLRGKRAVRDRQSIHGQGAPYSADTYVQGTEASTVELLERHGAVARRLVHRLLRAFRAPEQVYVTELSD